MRVATAERQKRVHLPKVLDELTRHDDVEVSPQVDVGRSICDDRLAPASHQLLDGAGVRIHAQTELSIETNIRMQPRSRLPVAHIVVDDSYVQGGLPGDALPKVVVAIVDCRHLEFA